MPSGIQTAVDALRDWGALIPDKARLNDIISHLDNVRATLDCSAHVSPKQQAAKDVKHALMLTYLKSSKSMHEFAGNLCDMVMPGTARQTELMGSYSQAQRNQFLVDLSYLLMVRDESFKTCFIKFSWADSSPQGRHDFLLWKNRQVAAKSLVRASELMRLLVTTRGGSLGGSLDDEAPLGVDEQRRAWNVELALLVIEYVLVPQTRYVFVLLFVVFCSETNKLLRGTYDPWTRTHWRRGQSVQRHAHNVAPVLGRGNAHPLP